MLHETCDHMVKINENGVFESGWHTTSSTKFSQQRGIHPLLLEYVDALLESGALAKVIRQRLNKKYEGNASMLDAIPTAQQLYARKKHITKSSCKLDTVASLKSFLLTKKVYIFFNCLHHNKCLPVYIQQVNFEDITFIIGSVS